MYNVQPGEIQFDVLYEVIGEKSVVYNGTTFNTGQIFRGINGLNQFDYSGTGSEQLIERTEIKGSGLVFEMTYSDSQFDFEATGIKGMSLIFELNEAEKIVQETTEMKGMSATLVDFPFYAFQWTETRFN